MSILCFTPVTERRQLKNFSICSPDNSDFDQKKKKWQEVRNFFLVHLHVKTREEEICTWITPVNHRFKMSFEINKNIYFDVF